MRKQTFTILALVMCAAVAFGGIEVLRVLSETGTANGIEVLSESTDATGASFEAAMLGPTGWDVVDVAAVDQETGQGTVVFPIIVPGACRITLLDANGAALGSVTRGASGWE